MAVLSFAVPLAVIVALHGLFVLAEPHRPEQPAPPQPGASASQLRVSDSPKQMKTLVKAIGDAKNGSIAETWQESLNAMGNILGKLVNGQSISTSDILEEAKNVVGAVITGIGFENPLLAIGIGFVLSFFGGLFGDKEPDVETVCYDLIYKLVPGMIDKAITASNFQSVVNQVKGLLDEEGYLSQMIDPNHPDLRRQVALQFSGDVTKLRQQVFGDCWDKPDVDSCKKWQAVGSAIPATMLATMHIHSLMETALAYDRPEDAHQRNVSLTFLIEAMPKYQQLLKDSLVYFTNSRQNDFADLTADCDTHRDIYPGPPARVLDCSGWCRIQNGKDSFGGGTDAWLWCGPPSPPPGPHGQLKDHEVDYMDDGGCNFPLDSVKQQVTDCNQKYRATVNDQISKVANLVQSFTQLPIPVPPTFAVPDGKYKIVVQKTGKRLHVKQLQDKLLSTRVQEDSIYTRFWVKNVGSGYVTIRVEANTQILYSDPSGKRLVSTLVQEDSNRTQYMLKPQGDGSFAVAVRGDGWVFFANENGNQLVNTISGPTVKDCSKFLFQPINVTEESHDALVI